MAIKLIKACKELNIGMATLTAWCEKNGHPIESDPNVRIDDDLYLLLAKEFNKDMATKIEADRQAAARQAREEEERKAAEAAKRAKEEAEAARAAAEKARREEAARQAREEEERKAAEAAKRAKEEEEAARLAAQKAAQAAKKEELNKQAASNQQAAVETSKPKPENKKPEIFTLGKPQLKHAPKVIGQIDLDAIDTSTRPAKKTKEQKRKEREARQQAQQAQQAQQQAAAAERRKRERIKNNAAKVDPNDKRNQAGKKMANPVSPANKNVLKRG
jgi:translation initiation factor IF-2